MVNVGNCSTVPAGKSAGTLEILEALVATLVATLDAVVATLDALATTTPSAPTSEFPFMLSAGERRSFTANTIIRNPDWRKKDAGGALSINPADAESVGVADGDRARLTTRRGSVEVSIQTSDRLQRGHLSLPNGLGLDFTGTDGQRVTAGVGPNELTRSEDRDRIAGTPWHKSTPARVERL